MAIENPILTTYTPEATSPAKPESLGNVVSMLNKTREQKASTLDDLDQESISKKEMDAFAAEISEKVKNGEISPEKAASDVYSELNRQSRILKTSKGYIEKGWHPSIKGTEMKPNALYRTWKNLRMKNRLSETRPPAPPRPGTEAETIAQSEKEERNTFFTEMNKREEEIAVLKTEQIRALREQIARLKETRPPAPPRPGTKATIITREQLEEARKAAAEQMKKDTERAPEFGAGLADAGKSLVTGDFRVPELNVPDGYGESLQRENTRRETEARQNAVLRDLREQARREREENETQKNIENQEIAEINNAIGNLNTQGILPPERLLPAIMKLDGLPEGLKTGVLALIHNEFPKVKIDPNGEVHGFFNQRRVKKLENGTGAQSQRFQELTEFLSKLNTREINIAEPVSDIPRKNRIEKTTVFGQTTKTGMGTESFSARVQRREQSRVPVGTSETEFRELSPADQYEHLLSAYGSKVKINSDASIPKRKTFLRNNEKNFSRLYATDPEFKKSYDEFYASLYGVEHQETNTLILDQATRMELWGKMSPQDQAETQTILSLYQAEGLNRVQQYVQEGLDGHIPQSVAEYLVDFIPTEELNTLPR
ncbi:MAG: hypothetical protein ABII02_01360 [Candidatus Magasanikbacteria bacterium]